MPDLVREYDIASDVTAVISILKESPAVSRQRGGGSEDVYYTILLWLVGKVLLPPYLPRITAHVTSGKRKRLLRQIQDLAAQYEKTYADDELDEDEAKRIVEDVKSLGQSIGSYMPQLYGCLKILPKLSKGNIRNVIIHTDEPIIPWHLAMTDFDDNLDFLCNRYACGTILVEDAEGIGESEAAIHPRFGYGRIDEQPDYDALTNKEFCLIAGEVGRSAPDGEDLGLAYIKRLKRRLDTSDLCQMEIQCVSAAEWGKNGKDPIDQLIAIFRRAQIVHFTGHFIDGRMKLSNNLFIGAEELAGLSTLRSKPLVVLHGCASVGWDGSGDAQVFKAFLNKGASGCLATVLPVNIPTVFADGAETLIEVFYEKLFKVPWKSYGIALKEARKAIWKTGAHHSDPQPLFYHFFGDPRETLISTRRKTVTDYIAQGEREEKQRLLKQPAQTKLVLRFSAEGIDEREVIEALEKMDGVRKATFQRPAAVFLGDPCICTIVVTVVGMGLALTYEPQIAATLARLFPSLRPVSPGAPKRPNAPTA